jgi:hypothetical protein
MKHWLIQVVIAIDQLVNALLNGWADETLSSRAYRVAKNNRWHGKVLMNFINALFFNSDHCAGAYTDERKGRQLHPEFRSKK